MVLKKEYRYITSFPRGFPGFHNVLPGHVARVDVAGALDQQLGDLGMAHNGGPHQRRPAVPRSNCGFYQGIPVEDQLIWCRLVYNMGFCKKNSSRFHAGVLFDFGVDEQIIKDKVDRTNYCLYCLQTYQTCLLHRLAASLLRTTVKARNGFSVLSLRGQESCSYH